MKTKKPAEEMTRTEVIDELRGQAHPSWFHSLLEWSTPQLKALLVFYRESDKEHLEKPESPRAMFGRLSSIERPLLRPRVSVISIELIARK